MKQQGTIEEIEQGTLRGRGRPRLEWQENVERLTDTRGKNINETKHFASDKTKYRKWLRGPTPNSKRISENEEKLENRLH